MCRSILNLRIKLAKYSALTVIYFFILNLNFKLERSKCKVLATEIMFPNVCISVFVSIEPINF